MGEFFTCNIHYENVPEFLQYVVREEFMTCYNDVQYVFSEHINEVNCKWNSLKGSYVSEDDDDNFEPGYKKFVNESIQPYIDELNKKLPVLTMCKYRLGKECNIEGYIPFIENSRIWITLNR